MEATPIVAGCTACHVSCKTCTGITNVLCATCYTATELPSRGVLTAFTCACATGFFEAATVVKACTACHLTCLTCTAATDATCVTCDASRLLASGKCGCAAGKFESSTVIKTCGICHVTCKTCVNALDAAKCATCDATRV